MHNNKLISILAHFNKIEQNRLRKYIISPYFNVNQSLVDLFEHLLIQIDANGTGEFNKEKIWKKLFPDKDFEDVRFRKLCSDLLKLIEGFLSQQIYDNNQVIQSTYLIEAVGNNNILKLYNSTMKTARRLINQHPYKNAKFHYYQYLIERNYYELTDFELNRTRKSNLEIILNNLDAFYISEKLKMYCSILSRKHMVSEEYRTVLIESIIEEVNANNYDHIPAIAIYYQIFLTQSDIEDESHYFKLKNLLDEYIYIFPKDEAIRIYTYAINYCLYKINKGSQLFHQEYMDLNEALLEKSIIGDEELSPYKFRNIVVIALRLGRYEWATNFIKKYSKKLPEHFRENAVTYALAQVFFYQKRFNKVLELLQTIEFQDFTYNLNSKAMLLATYYELDEIEPLLSLLESFRAYLNRHKNIALNRRKSYLNLIKFTKKLTKINPRNNSSINKIKLELETTTDEIASEKWLKEKIAELE